MKHAFAAPLFVCAAAVCRLTAAPSDLDRAAALIRTGGYDSARTVIDRAYKKDSADPRLQLWYAGFLLKAKDAETLLSHVTSNAQSPDSVRAAAYARQAELLWAQGNFAAAAGFYEQAFAASNLQAHRILHARAAYLSGNEKKAQQTFKQIIVARAPQARDAYYHLGSILLDNGNYSGALDCFMEAAEGAADTARWQVPVLAARLICSARMEFTGQAWQYRSLLTQRHPGYLEKALVDSLTRGVVFGDEDFGEVAAGVDGASASAAAKSRRPPQSGAVQTTAAAAKTYALQAGSFGSVENARALASKIMATAGDVSVSAVDVGGTTYHRVRVGAFATREDAEAYGQEHLSRNGFSFKVVTK